MKEEHAQFSGAIPESLNGSDPIDRDRPEDIVLEIFRVLAEDGFQRKARIEVLCSEPFAVVKRRLVLVP